MLWGHSIQYSSGEQFDFFEDVAFKIIYSFHMPFFMLISGYLFRFSEQKRNLTELIEYKVKSLLYPILMCSALNLLLSTGITVVLAKATYRALLGGTPIYSLWFLWSVLAASIALSLVVKFSGKPVIQIILAIAGIGIIVIFPCWDLNIYMYPYFVIGYIYARNENKLQPRLKVIGPICTALFIWLMFFFEKKHYIYTSGLFGGETLAESIKTDLFRWAIGLLGCITVIWGTRFVYGMIKKKNKITTVIEALGENSLAIYALSVSLLSFWLPIGADKILKLLPFIDWNRYRILYDLVITSAIAVIYSILLLWIVKLLKKTGVYKLIFGKAG